MQKHTSFLSQTESDFTTYATDLLKVRRTAADRQRAVAYMHKVLVADKKIIDDSRATYQTQRKLNKKHQETLDNLVSDHEFNFVNVSDIFQTETLTDLQINQKLAVNNTVLFLNNQTVATDITISGDNVTLDGSGSGDARTDLLASDVIVNGSLIIQGNNAVIKGVRFQPTATNCITFAANVDSVTLQDCIFVGPNGDADSKWFYGDGLLGAVTVKNCRVQDFTSWFLADFSTTSSTPTRALTNVTLEKNKFTNCAGSMSARGLQSDPIKLYKVVDNIFEHQNQHSLFWDTIEVNNFLRAIVKGNIATGAGHGDKRGFLQTWNKHPKPATLEYRTNTLDNFKVGAKTVHNTGFYALNRDSDRNVLDFDAIHTNVAFAYSGCYKKEDGSTASADKWTVGDFAPQNVAVYPTIPQPTSNPNSYPVVVQQNV